MLRNVGEQVFDGISGLCVDRDLGDFRFSRWMTLQRTKGVKGYSLPSACKIQTKFRTSARNHCAWEMVSYAMDMLREVMCIDVRCCLLQMSSAPSPYIRGYRYLTETAYT